MDKQTESREQFEAAAANKLNFSISTVIASRSGESYDSEILSIWWHFWQASRESLVVDLPKREAFESYPHESYMIDDDNGKYIPYAETVGAIRAIGIRIKGEGV